ncbi:MAG: leucine-rich repeat protein, partial [Oscillospiraceae bacterium]|nr:leucine-rich repeat protein [Oscillospiraceae bacterium]
TGFTIDEDAPYYTVQDGVVYNKELTKIASFPRERTEYTAPETITSIDPKTFAYAKLQSVTLPEGITEIPEQAFYRCLSLETVNLPDSVQTIGKNVFRECQSLGFIRLPQSLQTIGAVAFGHCDALEHVAFPDGLQEIGEGAFCDCVSLREIILPDSVTKLGTSVFSGCTAMRKLRLSAGLTEVECEKSWLCWDGLEGYDENNEPIYGGGADVVYNSIVSGCDSLETLIIPKEITKIGEGTFMEQPIRDTWYTGTEEEFLLLLQNEQPNEYGTVHYGYDESSELPGDLTLDNEFSVLDVVYMQRYLHGLYSLNGAAFQNADLNGDETVDVFDFALMKRALVNGTV